MEDQKVNLWDGVAKPETWNKDDQESFPNPEQIIYLFSLSPKKGIDINSICWGAGFEDERGVFGFNEIKMPLKDALLMASRAGFHISCGWGLQV
jgi:hypothetical protein